MIYAIVTALHFVFDWIMQSRDIAKAKHMSVDALGTHLGYNILPYLFILCTGFAFFYETPDFTLMIFLLINLITHGLIDWLLPKGNNERQMINWVALDQILHLSILFLTIEFLII